MWVVFVLGHPMRSALAALALVGLLTPLARAQFPPHDHHHHMMMMPSAHNHDLGTAGSTYDLRWLDAMVQHHTGALRMSEFVFDIGQPGVGALAKAIWRDQAQEIKAMGQWRKAWYPEAPVYPVVLKAAGDPNSLTGLTRMGPAQIEAMRMMGTDVTKSNRVNWFLEGMIAHHGGAVAMAEDALMKSTNQTIQRMARQIIVTQRREIIELKRMLNHNKI